MQKYGAYWRDMCQLRHQKQRPIACQLSDFNWLFQLAIGYSYGYSIGNLCYTIWTPVWADRLLVSSWKDSLAFFSGEIVNLLTSFLAQLGQGGPYGAEFFSLYMPLIRTDHWRYYLVSRGLLDCYQSLLTGSKWKLTDSLVKKQRAGRPNFRKAIQWSLWLNFCLSSWKNRPFAKRTRDD